jgi:hypothetical protein
MDRREVEDEAWVVGEPGVHHLGLVHAEVVEDEVDDGDVRGDARVEQNSAARLRVADQPMTSPVRVLKAANKFRAPSRR